MSRENVSARYLIKKIFERKLILEENDKQNLGNVQNINKCMTSREKSLSTIYKFHTNWQIKT